MAGTQPVEHLVFPGLDRGVSNRLADELDRAGRGARMFASGLVGFGVSVDYTLGHPRPGRWMENRRGELSIQLWVDLLSPSNLPAGRWGTPPSELEPEDYRAAFRSGFLHVLGRLLYSPGPNRPDPLESALNAPQPRLLKSPVRDVLATAAGRRLARVMWERLEAQRTDRLLRARFPHAGRHLDSRDQLVLLGRISPDPIERLLSQISWILRGEPETHGWVGLGGAEATDPGIPFTAGAGRRQAHALTPSVLRAGLRPALSAEGAGGAYELADFVLHTLLPALLDEETSPLVPEGSAHELVEALTENRRLRTLLPSRDLDTATVHEPVGSTVLRLPHVDGGESLVRVDVADAEELHPTELTSHVLERLSGTYGPAAHSAFMSEARGLRRALRINWDRRYRGRYRSGKRVGIPNLRRYMLQSDPRLFQRLEAPSALSYYFHVLVDASYSMLERDNASKALAAASGFTELLQTLRIPVDVTTYASAITQVFDHRRHAYRPYFGGDFGYLISGTMELEAIAFAKERADRVDTEHKLIVVLTDGTPVTSTLPHVGAETLDDYYTGTLVPWLRRSGIEMLALGIGVCPDYHPHAICLEEGWQSLGVLIDLLESIIQETERTHADLWS